MDIFPPHTNMTQFKPVENFVAVGIGPLYYDSDYVDKGEANKQLTGEILFMAERMEVVCPPLHVAGPHEKKIFNDFMVSNPKPSRKTWYELAKVFKAKTNYTTIFPKLPSMLKSYYNQWRDNQAIVKAAEGMKIEYRALLFELATPAPVALHPSVLSNRLQLKRSFEKVLAPQLMWTWMTQLTKMHSQCLLLLPWATLILLLAQKDRHGIDDAVTIQTAPR